MFNPIIGILASSGAVAAGSAYESIATVSVGSGGASNIEFTSIPSTYKHLQIRALYRTARTGQTLDAVGLYFNSDLTASNYRNHYLQADGGSATAGGDQSTFLGYNIATNGTASAFDGSVIDILDYTSTSKNKVVRHLTGFDANGSGYLYFGSIFWNNTAAISSIKLTSTYGTGFVQYTDFALYGIKD